MTGQQLKNSILQMAVQGKLVPQDPNDEPASALIERIRKEKEQLIKDGKIKKEKNPSFIFRGDDNLPYEKVGKNEPVCIADEVPFDIPDSWEWCRLGSILNKLSDGTHSTPKYMDNGVPFISVKDVSSGCLDFSNCKFISTQEHQKLYARCNPEQGDILLTKVGTTGIPVIVNTSEEFSLFVSVALLKFNQNLLCNEYLVYLINSPLVQKQATENTKGVGNKNWVMRDIANTLIVIPPLQEQYRIVEELKKYNRFLFEYDKKETELFMLNNSFPEQLKKSILQQAVQGKLVPQDPNDEPASILLERIRTEKQKLIKEGKIKKDKHESFIFKRDNSHYERQGNIERCIDDEIPFDIPNSWEWVRLKELAIKEIKRGKSPKYADNGSVYVFAQKCNVKLGGIDMSLAKLLDMKILEKYPVEEYMLDEDIIINSTGNGTLGRIGMFHDTDRINDFIIVPDSHVTIIRACNRLEKNYLFYTLKYYQPYLEKLGEGSTNQTELRPSTIAELFIPIPPIEEQKRIVQRANFLIESCNSL
jgi:type I restriction enzyme S subunit